ncbi:hypothetical protein TNCV_1907971 [Trichonephila clavipes]|nr:hypothetical protein TNCV_1907971 [Trichonephila clavipes]
MKNYQHGPGSNPQPWVQKASDKPTTLPSRLCGNRFVSNIFNCTHPVNHTNRLVWHTTSTGLLTSVQDERNSHFSQEAQFTVDSFQCVLSNSKAEFFLYHRQKLGNKFRPRSGQDYTKLHVRNLFCSQLILQSLLRTNDNLALSDFPPFQPQQRLERFVARALITLSRRPSTFESIKAFLNMCDPHSIVSKHFLDLTNCFTSKIPKSLTKN